MSLAHMPLEAVLIGEACATECALAFQSLLGLCPNFSEGLCASGIPVLCVSTQFRKLSLDGHSGALL